MSWTRKISHPNEVVEKGKEIECKVLSVDQNRRRIALGLKQMAEDPWAEDIPGKYEPGQIVKGQVTKITNFGVFVGLENGLEGLLHVSELADHKVDNPEEIVKVGEEIEVKILRVDQDERKIGLSRKRVEWAEEAEAEKVSTDENISGIPEVELKGGIGGGPGPLIQTTAIEEPVSQAEIPAAAESATEQEKSNSEEKSAEPESESTDESTETEESP